MIVQPQQGFLSWNGEWGQERGVDNWCLHPLGYQLIFTILVFAWVWRLRMGQGPDEMGGEGLQDAGITQAGVVGRERSLWQCTGLEFEGREQGGGFGNEKGDGGSGMGWG